MTQGSSYQFAASDITRSGSLMGGTQVIHIVSMKCNHTCYNSLGAALSIYIPAPTPSHVSV